MIYQGSQSLQRASSLRKKEIGFTLDDENGHFKNAIELHNREQFEKYKSECMTQMTQNLETGHQYLHVQMVEKKHKCYQSFMTLKTVSIFKQVNTDYFLEDRILLDITNGDSDLEFDFSNDDILIQNNHTYYF